MFSKACEYGMRATIYVAQQSERGKRIGVKAIAKAIQSPEAFTGKIMQQLAKKKIVESVKGPYGGFFISEKAMKTIKLSNIVTLFDGEKAYTGCILGLSTCSDTHPCPLHKEVLPIIEKTKQLLETKSLYDLLYTEGIKNQFWLKTE